MNGRRIVFQAPRRAVIESFEVPAPGPRQVLVRTTRTLVSAGTELKAYLGVEHRGLRPYPIYPGYSNVGVVEAVGDGAEEFLAAAGVRLGDRVATLKRHASHVLLDLARPNQPALPSRGPARAPGGADWLQQIPDGVSDEAATFTVLGSVALHGVRKGQVRLEDTCAVAGLGVVGQLVAQLAQRDGARPVIGTDLDEARREKALGKGIDYALDPTDPEAEQRIVELTEHGVDVAFDCMAATLAFSGLLRMAATEGRIVIVGSLVGRADISLFDEIQLKELNIIGAFQPMAPTVWHPAAPWTQAANRRAILDLLAAGRLRVDHLISHVAPAEHADELYGLMGSGPRGWLGTIFTW